MGHDVAITDLYSSESDTLVSADESGNIAIWKTGDKAIDKINMIKGYKYVLDYRYRPNHFVFV